MTSRMSSGTCASGTVFRRLGEDMTRYTIEVGYNGGVGHDPDDVWDFIVSTVAEIRANRDLIRDEIKRVEPNNEAEPDELEECVEAYHPENNDLTIRVQAEDPYPELRNPKSDFEFERNVNQGVSGGGSYAVAKHVCRRAVCRLIIVACHAKGMEVCLRVG